MHKKEYHKVTMRTIALPAEDIVSTSAATTANDDHSTFDIYSDGWTGSNQ